MHDILKCFFFIYLFFLIQVFKCNDYLSCSKSKCYIYCFSFWKSEHLILSYHGGHHSNCYHRAYCIQRLLSCIVCTDGFFPVIEYLLHWVADTTIQKKWQKCNCLCLTSLTISVLIWQLPSEHYEQYGLSSVFCTWLYKMKRKQNHEK